MRPPLQRISHGLLFTSELLEHLLTTLDLPGRAGRSNSLDALWSFCPVALHAAANATPGSSLPLET